jgi:urease gamma subunit
VARDQIDLLDEKRKQIEEMLRKNHPTAVANLRKTNEEALREGKRVFVRDYANNVILAQHRRPEDEKALTHPINVYATYKDVDFGLEQINPGVELGLAGVAARPSKERMKSQSVRRTRMYWDYQNRSHIVDLQDPPDVWNPVC